MSQFRESQEESKHALGDFDQEDRFDFANKEFNQKFAFNYDEIRVPPKTQELNVSKSREELKFEEEPEAPLFEKKASSDSSSCFSIKDNLTESVCSVKPKIQDNYMAKEN